MDPILEKIMKIRALVERPGTEGERQAALTAFKRLEKRDVLKEFTIYSKDMWHKRLFLALCRKYGLEPYRYRRQKYTTVMVNVSEDYLNNVVWKEYLEYSKILEGLIEEITGDVISRIHEEEDETIIAGRLES